MAHQSLQYSESVLRTARDLMSAATFDIIVCAKRCIQFDREAEKKTYTFLKRTYIQLSNGDLAYMFSGQMRNKIQNPPKLTFANTLINQNVHTKLEKKKKKFNRKYDFMVSIFGEFTLVLLSI